MKGLLLIFPYNRHDSLIFQAIIRERRCKTYCDAVDFSLQAYELLIHCVSDSLNNQLTFVYIRIDK